MEKFDHKDYRDDLAKDLKNIPNHKEREEALDLEKNSFRYEDAKKLHREDVRIYTGLLESADLRAEEISKSLWVSFLGEELAEVMLKDGCFCSLGFQQEEEDKYIKSKLINEFRASIGMDIPEFDAKVDENDSSVQREISKRIKEKALRVFGRLQTLFGKDALDSDSSLGRFYNSLIGNVSVGSLCYPPNVMAEQLSKLFVQRDIKEIESSKE
jgi:hypothetical protein